MSKKDFFILTYSGRFFHPFSPSIEEICLEDIAHSLSMICRFGGHCNKFYSVAQHSLFVAENVTYEAAREALLHDASEAYIGDIVAPFKWGLLEVQEVEKNIQKLIAEKFNLIYPFPKEVKDADLLALSTEGSQLRIGHIWNTPIPKPLPVHLNPWPPEKAKMEFLKEAGLLGIKNG